LHDYIGLCSSKAITKKAIGLTRFEKLLLTEQLDILYQ
jgi:hypothetical protein